MKKVKCWILHVDNSPAEGESFFHAKMYESEILPETNFHFWLEVGPCETRSAAKEAMSKLLLKLRCYPRWVKQSGIPE